MRPSEEKIMLFWQRERRIRSLVALQVIGTERGWAESQPEPMPNFLSARLM